MKAKNCIIILLALVAAFTACRKDEEIPVTVLSVVTDSIKASYTSVYINCHLSGKALVSNVSVEFAKNKIFTDSEEAAMIVGTDSGRIYTLDSDTILEYNTTYYFRYIISNKISSYTTVEIDSFLTLEPTEPRLDSIGVSQIEDRSAWVVAQITDDGGSRIVASGFDYWPSDESNEKYHISVDRDQSGKMLTKLTDLQPNTTYIIRAYATNGKGISYGEELSFTTQELPEIKLLSVNGVSRVSATAIGSVVKEGNPSFTEKGVCWAKETNPTITDKTVAFENDSTEFQGILTNLAPGTKYYVRAYAKHELGVVYSNELSFETLALSIPKVTTNAVTSIIATSAECVGNVTDDGGLYVTERGVCYSSSHNPTISNSKVISDAGTGSFHVTLSGLILGTTYYVRAYATNAKGTAYGEEKSFTAESIPTVTTGTISSVTTSSASVVGNVESDGGQDVTERGVCYSTSQKPTMSNSKVTSGNGTGSFSATLLGLAEGTTYYVRAYALNSVGPAYGEEYSFTTVAASIPTVTTGAISSITMSSASVAGNVELDGRSHVTERGICYSTSQNPTISNNKVTFGSGTGSFSCSLSGLSAGTTYYVRAYATNSKGTAYGEEKSFTTGTSIPTVTTGAVTNITSSSASIGYSVTSDGGATVTARGICYNTSQNPTISNNKVTSGSGTGSFSCDLTGLSAGTTYYIRAYATNSKGTAYGEQNSFTTGTSVPTVTTGAVSNITSSSASVMGNVTSDGGATITARGICYSTSQNPTISNKKVTAGSGTGSIIYSLSRLSAGTTYYVRAYATNSKGTAYGEEKSFTTGTSVPAVTTGTVSNITSSSASVIGNVTSDGGATVTARGICYNTSQNPTISNKKVTSDSGTGTFNCSLSRLSASTTYYVRAYATNSAGTAYGEEKSFTTEETSVPIVTTGIVSDITSSSALVTGNVISSGGVSVDVRGICYSIFSNPTTSDSKVTSGSGMGSFSATLSGLTDGTTYYVRAYATNSNGTAYGEEISFTTEIILLPTVLTVSVTNVTSMSATGTINVTSDGGSTVTECGICASLTPNPTINNWVISSSGGLGTISLIKTGLSAGTTYYIRAYATNSKGTAYGEQMIFTTLSSYHNGAPEGAVAGLFSVSSTEQVFFSKGNLQYQASTNTWRFAENQFDYVGGASTGGTIYYNGVKCSNSEISSTYSGWIDLFGWGTGNSPTLASTNDSDYDIFIDWGINKISNGGNAANNWRTLTKDEWEYLYSRRTNASQLRGWACVNNIFGYIFLPDSWSLPSGLSFVPNGGLFVTNSYSVSGWAKMESAGAVFLPMAGYRVGVSLSSGGGQIGTGHYWSYSPSSSYDFAFVRSLTSHNQEISNCDKYEGRSVRLVQDN